MGIFDFFKGKGKKPNKKKQQPQANAEPLDLTNPSIENGVLKSVLNHHVKNGVFVMPREARTIVSFAFMNCDNLETLVFHDSIRYIDTGAFSLCPNLKRIVGLEHQRDLRSIDGFARCGKLEVVKLPETVNVIKNSAFKDCVKLKDISIPDACWCIGDYAFENCRALDGLELPATVTMIGKDAFKGCYNLTVVFTDAKQEETEEVVQESQPDDELEIESGAFSGVKAVYAYDVKVIEKVIASGFRGTVAYYDKEHDRVVSMDLNLIENIYFDSLKSDEILEEEIDVALIDEIYRTKFGEPTEEELAEEEMLMQEELDDEDELGDE